MLHGLRYCDWCGPTARQGEWQSFSGMRTPEGVVWKPDPKGEVRVCPTCIEAKRLALAGRGEIHSGTEA